MIILYAVIKNEYDFHLTFFVSFHWWVKKSILHLINLTTSCIILESKLKQNEYENKSKNNLKKLEDKFPKEFILSINYM